MSFENEKQGHSIDRNIHFTYKSKPDMETLCQGDVLEITKGLYSVLQDIHPYFLNGQYKYFMVLSQSCDLVRRDGKRCKTPYITLAAVRSYTDFLKKVLLNEKYAEKVNELLLMDEKNKERAYQLIERIYNNTEPEYFFLYKEDVLELPESMVAYLKVSIALKSIKHYDTCLAAKKIELADEFKAKLGWLVGNMYSRVGTSDWTGLLSKQAKKEMLNKDLNSMCIISSKELLNNLKEQFVKQPELTYRHEEAAKFISNLPIKTKYDKVMDIIESVIRAPGREITIEEKEKILNELKSKSTLKALIT